jgi:cytochrome b561
MRGDGDGGWSRAQRGLHWWTAALIFFALPLGFLMVAVPLGDLFAKFLLYQLHKTIGITVLLLVAVRLWLRVARGRPAWERGLPHWQRRLAAAAHGALFGLMIATPVLGYFTAATAPAQVPTLFLLLINIPHLVGVDAQWYATLRPVHLTAAVLLVALAIGHAGAAVLQHVRGRETLVRMWSGGNRQDEWR